MRLKKQAGPPKLLRWGINWNDVVFRHHRRRRRRASRASGSGGIPTPMRSPSQLLQRRRQQRVNRAGPVRPGPRTGPGPGGARFGSAAAGPAPAAAANLHLAGRRPASGSGWVWGSGARGARRLRQLHHLHSAGRRPADSGIRLRPDVGRRRAGSSLASTTPSSAPGGSPYGIRLRPGVGRRRKGSSPASTTSMICTLRAAVRHPAPAVLRAAVRHPAQQYLKRYFPWSEVPLLFPHFFTFPSYLHRLLRGEARPVPV